MNFSDLFIVVVIVAGLFGLIVAVVRQRQFLTKAVNPHRVAWIIAALTLFWGGIALLRLEAHSWDLDEWSRIFGSLVTEERLSARAKIAAVAMITGVLFGLLVLWCWLFSPRDPTTFRRPRDRRRAFRYYVSRLRGGLDYAVLCRNDGQRLEEAWAPRPIRTRLDHFPRVEIDGKWKERTLEDQIEFWRATAADLHKSMAMIDEVVGRARQGKNRRMVFDAEFGGLFFMYLRVADPRDRAGDTVYLFAATLNQEQMNLKIADVHFDLLVQAMRHIEGGIRVG
jgi:hypothetical protein